MQCWNALPLQGERRQLASLQTVAATFDVNAGSTIAVSAFAQFMSQAFDDGLFEVSRSIRAVHMQANVQHDIGMSETLPPHHIQSQWR